MMITDKEKRLEQARERLSRREYLKDYLKELNALTNIEVVEDMLLSRIETNTIGYVAKQPVYKTEILFKDKERLLIYIGQLIKLKDGECTLHISYSRSCGALQLKSLKDFNINFNFNDESKGILTIVLKDLTNELILDYSEENGEYYLEIEAYGEDWSKARIED